MKILTTQGEKMRKIYTNGNIYTVTNGNAEAFVEEEGKFIYVGNNEGALSYKQEDSEIITAMQIPQPVIAVVKHRITYDIPFLAKRCKNPGPALNPTEVMKRIRPIVCNTSGSSSPK